MNRITLHGHLTRDPERRETQKSSVCNFTVAVNRRFDRDQSDFFHCQAWGKLGDMVDKYFARGGEILLSGEMRSREYEAKDGSKRTAWDVNVDEVDFCGKAGDKKRAEPGPAQSFEPAKPISTDALEFTDIEDEDLPF